MLLKGGKAFYLGGIEDRKCPDCGETVYPGEAANHGRRRLQNREPDKTTPADILFRKLLGSDDPGESTTRWLNSTHNPASTSCRTKHVKELDFLLKPRSSNKEKGKIEVICPTLDGLASHFESELADSRGLNVRDCHNYERVWVDNPYEACEKFQYQLGGMYMDRVLLGLFKEAMELFKPDGYHFTPSRRLSGDIADAFGPVLSLLGRRDARRFRQFERDDPRWPKSCPPTHRAHLYYAMLLCNELQALRFNAYLSMDDTALLRKASYTLRESIPTKSDLVWAMFVCPQLYQDLAELFYEMESLDILGTFVSCAGEVLDCSDLMAPNQTEKLLETVWTYPVPLCGDGRFSGMELLAAFMDLTITGFWVSARWTSDVGLYDPVIPPTVTMC